MINVFAGHSVPERQAKEEIALLGRVTVGAMEAGSAIGAWSRMEWDVVEDRMNPMLVQMAEEG